MSPPLLQSPPPTLRARSRCARRWAVACLVTAVPCGAQVAATPAAAAPSALSAALEREVAAARQAAREVGVHVVDLSQRSEVYGFESDRQRILASNTKLLTTAAALSDLGPDFRFRTRFELRGEVVGEALRGDVAVFGAGDPNLSGRFHDGDSYAPFRPWARALRARGVRRVEGELLLVNGIFEEPRIHPDWPRDQLTAWYEAPIDALSFNDNCVLVRVAPGRRSGLGTTATTVPAMDHFPIRNSSRTLGGHGGKLIVSREAASDALIVTGTIGERSAPLEVWVAVRDPAAYFAAAVRGAFAEEGVELAKGAFRYLHAPPDGDWQPVGVHESELSPTLAVTNKRSQNFYAESLAKLLGFKLRGAGSWASAASVVSDFLVGLGIDGAEFQVADGSGLSRANRATPRAMTRLLDRMYFHPYGREYLQSLPYSGEDGLSWERRLAVAPYRGNVFAKTGSLRGVSTLSGYAKASSGKVYAFSILLNRTTGGWAARTAQDRIVRALIDLG